MEIVHLDKCPLCGSGKIRKVMTARDGYASGKNFDIYACECCGFRMTQDVPSEAFIGAYYQSSDYISHTDTHEGLMSQMYHMVRSFMLQRKASLIERESHNKGSLLDIGAGTGYFVSFMRERGWMVKATEKSPQARLFAKSHFDLDILEPEALSSIPSQSMDVITLWHVLEHLEHLDDVWKELGRILKADGRLFVAVPNAQSHDARHYGKNWAALDVPRHLWHFTPSTMSKWSEKEGFQLMSYHRMVFDSFYVSMLTEKQQGRSFYLLRGFWEGMVSFLSAAVSKDCCSSLIYVFKRLR